MVDHLEKFHLINDSQHGFKRGRSCLTNLIESFDIVTQSVDTGDNVDTVYLGFAKYLIRFHINDSLVNWKHTASKEKFYYGLSGG